MITLSGGASSTKCFSNFGAHASLANTILTVYAGPQIRIPGSEGENRCMSGMWPPCGRPSLIRASEISQEENWESTACEDLTRFDIQLLHNRVAYYSLHSLPMLLKQCQMKYLGGIG